MGLPSRDLDVHLGFKRIKQVLSFSVFKVQRFGCFSFGSQQHQLPTHLLADEQSVGDCKQVARRIIQLVDRSMDAKLDCKG